MLSGLRDGGLALGGSLLETLLDGPGDVPGDVPGGVPGDVPGDVPEIPPPYGLAMALDPRLAIARARASWDDSVGRRGPRNIDVAHRPW